MQPRASDPERELDGLGRARWEQPDHLLEVDAGFVRKVPLGEVAAPDDGDAGCRALRAMKKQPDLGVRGRRRRRLRPQVEIGGHESRRVRALRRESVGVESGFVEPFGQRLHAEVHRTALRDRPSASQVRRIRSP